MLNKLTILLIASVFMGSLCYTSYASAEPNKDKTEVQFKAKDQPKKQQAQLNLVSQNKPLGQPGSI